jgi:hypothetical protein
VKSGNASTTDCGGGFKKMPALHMSFLKPPT